MAEICSLSDLFPKPKKSKSASGKSLQSIFEDIYKGKSGNVKMEEQGPKVLQKHTKNRENKKSSFTSAKVKNSPKDDVSKGMATKKQNTSSVSPKKEKFKKKLPKSSDSTSSFKESGKSPLSGETPNSNFAKKEKRRKRRHSMTKSPESSKHHDTDDFLKNQTNSETESGMEAPSKEKNVNKDIDFPRNKSKKRKLEAEGHCNSDPNAKAPNLFNEGVSPSKKPNKHLLFNDDDEDDRKKRPKLTQNREVKKHGEKFGNKKNPNKLHEKQRQEDNEEQSQEDNKTKQKRQKRNKLKAKIPETVERLSRTLFVGNLPLTSSRKEIAHMFRDCGALETVRLRGGVPEKSSLPIKVAEIKKKFSKHAQSRSAYVVFKSEEDAKKAQMLKNSILVENRHIVVDFATQFGEKKLYDQNLSIFIGNLPFDVDDESVRSIFESCGTIENLRIIRDKRTGVGKGFGYVLFKDKTSKSCALKLSNANISGREIRVKDIDRSAFGKDRDQSNEKNKHWLNKRRNALKLKKQQDGPHRRKSTKKIMQKQKFIREKKKIAKILQK